MLRQILAFSLQFRSLVVVLAAALMFFGVLRLRDAPLDVLPEFKAPMVEIQTEALGLSAAEVEELVTVNLEEILASTAWLKTLSSKSLPGLSSVLLVFEPGTDLMEARQLVQERLNMAYALPNVSKPPVMLQPLSTTNRSMIVGLSSKDKDVSLIDMSVLARWTIAPKLLGVPGVANVAIWGQRSRQLQVQVDPKHLQAMGVTLDQVVETAGDALWVSPLSFLEASTPGTGGWIDTPNQRLAIQHRQPIVSPGDLAEVALADKPLRLKDVAKVVEEHPPLIGDAIVDGEPGLLMVVERFPGSDALEVNDGVDAALDELRQGLPGIEIDTSIFRSDTFIETSVENLGVAAAIGGVLLIAALGAWFLSWRAVLISAVAIPLSLVAAGLVLSLRGVPFDAMVLAGLAAALVAVIDGAVIQVENILRRLRQQRSQGGDRSTAAAIYEACAETHGPIVYATLVAVLAVAPVLLLGGPAGAFFGPLAVSYVLALLASLAVALTVTPALALLLLRGGAPLDQREPPAVRWLRPRYDGTVARIVGAPRPAFLAAGLVVLAGLAVSPLLSWSLLPSFDEGDVRVSWKTVPGTSLPEARRIATQVSKELGLIPGVSNVTAHIGRAVTGDQVVDVEAGQIWVSVDPDADHGTTLAAIRETVLGYPGFDGEVQGYLTAKVREGLTGAGDPVVVRIQGPERGGLRREAEKVAQALSGIAGIANLRVENPVETPHVAIKVDLAAAGRVGLKPGDIRRAAATVFAGLEVGNLYEQQKVFEVVVWGAPESRRSLTDLRELLIETPAGGHVRLADVAEVVVEPTAAVIDRHGFTIHADIRADVAGRDPGSVVADVEEQLRTMEFPLEYHPVLLGDYAAGQAAYRQASIAAVAAAIGIYLLLQACFQSWLFASLFGLTLLGALAGGVLAMLLAGGTVYLGSLVGLLAVLGVAVRHGIQFVDACRSLERREGQALGPELVLRGARQQVGPTVTSATAIGVAFLPMVFSGGIAGLEILHPMAVVVLGGLVTSAMMNLFVVPALYSRFARPAGRADLSGDEQYAAS
jgi:CzcA family heavy metal efflux pump